MAYDPRFAIAYISSPGAGGAELYRRNFGEQMGNLAGTGEYHWFAGNFIKYDGPLYPKDLPVDSHELIALWPLAPSSSAAAPQKVTAGPTPKAHSWPPSAPAPSTNSSAKNPSVPSKAANSPSSAPPNSHPSKPHSSTATSPSANTAAATPPPPTGPPSSSSPLATSTAPTPRNNKSGGTLM